MKIIDRKKLDELAAQAVLAPRKRTHFNLHESLEAPIQRLCVTGEKETVFPPHRHCEKWELSIILKGRALLTIYNDDGSVKESFEMIPGGVALSAVEIPEGIWHNYVFLESGTTLLEVKKGPFVPISPEDTAPFPGNKPS